MPLQTAVWKSRAAGALAVLVAIQLSDARLISSAGVNGEAVVRATPHDHFSASPNRCYDRARARWCIVSAGVCPTVCVRIVPCPRCLEWRTTIATPDDHFVPRPYRCL